MANKFWLIRAFIHCNKDIFTNPIPPFNAQIRIQKKLLEIMRFSESLKIEILGVFFRYFARFFCNLSLFIEIDGLFEKKRRVVLFKTTRHSFYFKGHFSNYVRRNFFFVRENFYFVRENREKFENSFKIRWSNDFELT